MSKINNSNNNNSRGGTSILGLFALAFTILKIIGFIDWSWWLVFAPIWVPIVIIIVILLVAVIFT